MEEKKEQKDKAEQKIPKRNNSVSRLMRDLKEWMKNKNEFPCIDAMPLDDNIHEWHCNISPESGYFQGLIFHLILYFKDNYPLTPPDVKLCTTIPHSNVFDDWICLDMIKSYEQGRYKGWTSCYSVTSILMQLQSFLFEDESIDQMDYDFSIKRHFDQSNFEKQYLNDIINFKCDKCEHCYTKPYPVPLSVIKRNKMYEDIYDTIGKSGNKNSKNGKNKNKNTNKNAKGKTPSESNGKSENNNNHKNGIIEEKAMAVSKDNDNNNGANNNNCDFAFWDGIYKDLEDAILEYFNLKDLMKLQRVAKRFQHLVYNLKVIQKDSIKCWFHRVAALPKKELDFKNSGKYKEDDIQMLLLGFGIKPNYFDGNDGRPISTLESQIFSNTNKRELATPIRKSIGSFNLIESIDITFDLLSSDAFENYKIRKTVFKDREFTHFLPLYIYPKHGKLCLNDNLGLKKYIMKIWKPKCGKGEYHPWLVIQTIANIMKSLIVSVMRTCEGGDSDDNSCFDDISDKSEEEEKSGNGKLSLHHSINILETFFRLHHTLLAFFLKHYDECGLLLKHQINLFLSKKDENKLIYRNKRCIPDFGIFFVYLTLWKNPNNLSWYDIGKQLLDETFTRQCKWVLQKHNILSSDDNVVKPKNRLYATWDTSQVSLKLFMFNYFFYKQCCGLGNGKKVNLRAKLKEYNDNFGFPKDGTLPYKLQAFVKQIQNNVNCYSQFFHTIEMYYPGMEYLSTWLKGCMLLSEKRGYHRREYVPTINTYCEDTIYDATKEKGFKYHFKKDVKPLELPIKEIKEVATTEAGASGSMKNNDKNTVNQDKTKNEANGNNTSTNGSKINNKCDEFPQFELKMTMGAINNGTIVPLQHLTPFLGSSNVLVRKWLLLYFGKRIKHYFDNNNKINSIGYNLIINSIQILHNGEKNRFNKMMNSGNINKNNKNKNKNKSNGKQNNKQQNQKNSNNNNLNNCCATYSFMENLVTSLNTQMNSSNFSPVYRYRYYYYSRGTNDKDLFELLFDICGLNDLYGAYFIQHGLVTKIIDLYISKNRNRGGSDNIARKLIRLLCLLMRTSRTNSNGNAQSHNMYESKQQRLKLLQQMIDDCISEDRNNRNGNNNEKIIDTICDMCKEDRFFSNEFCNGLIIRMKKLPNIRVNNNHNDEFKSIFSVIRRLIEIDSDIDVTRVLIKESETVCRLIINYFTSKSINNYQTQNNSEDVMDFVCDLCKVSTEFGSDFSKALVKRMNQLLHYIENPNNNKNNNGGINLGMNRYEFGFIFVMIKRVLKIDAHIQDAVMKNCQTFFKLVIDCVSHSNGDNGNYNMIEFICDYSESNKEFGNQFVNVIVKRLKFLADKWMGKEIKTLFIVIKRFSVVNDNIISVLIENSDSFASFLLQNCVSNEAARYNYSNLTQEQQQQQGISQSAQDKDDIKFAIDCCKKSKDLGTKVGNAMINHMESMINLTSAHRMIISNIIPQMMSKNDDIKNVIVKNKTVVCSQILDNIYYTLLTDNSDNGSNNGNNDNNNNNNSNESKNDEDDDNDGNINMFGFVCDSLCKDNIELSNEFGRNITIYVNRELSDMDDKNRIRALFDIIAGFISINDSITEKRIENLFKQNLNDKFTVDILSLVKYYCHICININDNEAAKPTRFTFQFIHRLILLLSKNKAFCKYIIDVSMNNSDNNNDNGGAESKNNDNNSDNCNDNNHLLWWYLFLSKFYSTSECYSEYLKLLKEYQITFDSIVDRLIPNLNTIDTIGSKYFEINFNANLGDDTTLRSVPFLKRRTQIFLQTYLNDTKCNNKVDLLMNDFVKNNFIIYNRTNDTTDSEIDSVKTTDWFFKYLIDNIKYIQNVIIHLNHEYKMNLLFDLIINVYKQNINANNKHLGHRGIPTKHCKQFIIDELIKILYKARSNSNQFGQCVSLITRLANVHKEYFISNGLMAKLGHFYLGNDSPYPNDFNDKINSKYSNKNNGNKNNNNGASYQANYEEIMKLFSILVRSCHNPITQTKMSNNTIPLFCCRKHGLKQFSVPDSYSCWCNICDKWERKGATMFGCRKRNCNYYLCQPCFQRKSKSVWINEANGEHFIPLNSITIKQLKQVAANSNTNVKDNVSTVSTASAHTNNTNASKTVATGMVRLIDLRKQDRQLIEHLTFYRRAIADSHKNRNVLNYVWDIIYHSCFENSVLACQIMKIINDGIYYNINNYIHDYSRNAYGNNNNSNDYDTCKLETYLILMERLINMKDSFKYGRYYQLFDCNNVNFSNNRAYFEKTCNISITNDALLIINKAMLRIINDKNATTKSTYQQHQKNYTLACIELFVRKVIDIMKYDKEFNMFMMSIRKKRWGKLWDKFLFANYKNTSLYQTYYNLFRPIVPPMRQSQNVNMNHHNNNHVINHSGANNQKSSLRPPASYRPQQG